MKEAVKIPGGTANFRDANDPELPGRSVKILKAAATSAVSHLSDYPELFEPQREGESEEDRNTRLDGRLQGMKLSVDQAMALDNLREATVVATLESWTLDRRLPTLDTIGDLPAELYNALLEQAGGLSAIQLEENFNATKDPNDGAPTGDSGSSDGPSKPGPESLPMTTSSTDTAPSSGESSSLEQ